MQPWSLAFPVAFTFANYVPSLTDRGSFQTIDNAAGTPFTFGGTTSNPTIKGTVSWTEVKDGTEAPDFLGYLTVTQNNASGALYSAFDPAKGPYYVDINFHLTAKDATTGKIITLADLWNGTYSETSTKGTFFIGAITGAPEPATVFVLGAALLGLCRIMKRRSA